MLDGDRALLTRTGTVVITADSVFVEGFEGDGTSCRDVAALGALWAIGRLQAELMETLKAPSGGKIIVD